MYSTRVDAIDTSNISNVISFDLAQPHFMSAAALMGNYLYVTGGTNSGSPTDMVEVIDIRDLSHAVVDPLPTPRVYHTSFFSPTLNAIVVAGGNVGPGMRTKNITLLFCGNGVRVD